MFMLSAGCIEEHTVKTAGGPSDLRRSSMQNQTHKASPECVKRARHGVQGFNPWWGAGAKPLPAGGPVYFTP